MFKFFIKKNFVDIWDNIFHSVIINFITNLVIIASVFLIPYAFSFIPVSPDGFPAKLINVLSVFVSSIIVNILIFAESSNAFSASNSGKAKLKDFFTEIPVVFKHAVASGIFFGLLILASTVSLPYYHSMYLDTSNIVFLGMTMLLIWILAVTVLSLQYLLPVYAIMKNDFLKSLKKCYIIFFDNTLFTTGLGILNLVNTAVTVLSFGFAPGVTGISITCTNALRLRLYKYDWLEVNPELSKEEKKNVPWKDLLKKEEEILGPHPIKAALFPWKYR